MGVFMAALLVAVMVFLVEFQIARPKGWYICDKTTACGLFAPNEL